MIWAIIAIGFLVPVAVGYFTRLQPMIAGFVWPIVVALLTAIYVFGIETRALGEEPQKIAITFYALFSLVGGVPGGLAGWILQYKRSTKQAG
jgi:ABC-type proline/glycine betaine transport system permease subunit